MKHYNKMGLAVGLLTLVAGLMGCTATIPQGEPSSSDTQPAIVAASGSTGYRSYRWRLDQEKKYTKADYDLALSFMVDGYQDMSVEEFDRKVMDWDNEDAYHKTEEALERLASSLPDDDTNGEFIFRTLFTSWRESEKKHYSACQRDKDPWYSGWVQVETMGDIFGDQVVLAGAYANFSFNYNIPDESNLTIGQRDSLLKSIESSLQDYLKNQEQKVLAKEDTMKKALTTELERLLKAAVGGVAWAGTAELNYWWDQSWSESESTADGVVSPETATESNQWPETYTKAQYDLVVGKLKPDGYESMSVAEFNRRVNALFSGMDDSIEHEDFFFAYDLVLSYLPETDPNFSFLHDTVAIAQNEYEARSEEVYSGRTVDPEIKEYVTAEVMGDVFGDKVVVGAADAYYSFTYRLLDPEKLTAAERDRFFTTIRERVKAELQANVNNENFDEAALKKIIENVGNGVNIPYIQFTGCRVDTCEIYR